MRRVRKAGFLAGCLTLSLWAALSLGDSRDLPAAYTSLESEMVRNGLNPDFASRVFSDPRNRFQPDIVRKIATLRKERPADYRHFAKREVVLRGRQYLQTHRHHLHRAAGLYGVPPEVIVAILTVESNLGNITGAHSVFNVFSSLAVMDTPEVMTKTGLGRDLHPRAVKKAAWARRELRIFLEYCHRNLYDPYEFHGSWAGAIGYAQFLPSSLVELGADGDDDGRVDLFRHADAIFSIANYLQNSGFRGETRGTWRRAVLAYNHSEAYADTVLRLASSY